jgi:gluconolactonase
VAFLPATLAKVINGIAVAAISGSALFSLSASAADAAAVAVAPAIPGVTATGTKVEFIREGFEGTEGPIAAPDSSFLFTETRANRITKIATDNSISTFLENSNGSNGLAFNDKGELITVQVTKWALSTLKAKKKYLLRITKVSHSNVLTIWCWRKMVVSILPTVAQVLM